MGREEGMQSCEDGGPGTVGTELSIGYHTDKPNRTFNVMHSKGQLWGLSKRNFTDFTKSAPYCESLDVLYYYIHTSIYLLYVVGNFDTPKPSEVCI